MKTLAAASLSLLLLSGASTYAQEAATPQGQESLEAPVQPPSAAPLGVPPPAPEQVPAPPQAAPQATSAQPQPPSTTAGQWAYTTQYGWVWMAYGAQYTSAPVAAGAVPYAYVYYPSAGWRWLSAPWVLGRGPTPYFGAYGTSRFSWYRPGFYAHGYAAPGYRAPAAGYHPAVGFYAHGYPPASGYRAPAARYHAAVGFSRPAQGRFGYAGRGSGRR